MNEQSIKKEIEEISRFIGGVGEAAWGWNALEYMLDNSIANISKIDSGTLNIILPDANIRRKFAIFNQLLKHKKYAKATREEAAKQTLALGKLLSRRNEIVHNKSLAIFLESTYSPDVLKRGRGKHEKLNSKKILKLNQDLLKAYFEFRAFLVLHKLYK